MHRTYKFNLMLLVKYRIHTVILSDIVYVLIVFVMCGKFAKTSNFSVKKHLLQMFLSYFYFLLF